MAKTDKSRLVTEAMARAKEVAQTYPDAEVPFHLRSKATRYTLKKSAKHGTKTTDYSDPFLPEELKDIRIL